MVKNFLSIQEAIQDFMFESSFLDFTAYYPYFFKKKNLLNYSKILINSFYIGPEEFQIQSDRFNSELISNNFSLNDIEDFSEKQEFFKSYLFKINDVVNNLVDIVKQNEGENYLTNFQKYVGIKKTFLDQEDYLNYYSNLISSYFDLRVSLFWNFEIEKETVSNFLTLENLIFKKYYSFLKIESEFIFNEEF